MKTIWKYTIPAFDWIQPMPPDAQVIHVGKQNEVICMWVILPASSAHLPTLNFHVRVVGTGHDVPDAFSAKDHISTIIDDRYGVVWHVFGRFE